jgi:hypothetical protein
MVQPLAHSARWVYPQALIDPRGEVELPTSPLRLYEKRVWDPAEQYRRESDGKLEMCLVEVIAAGPRLEFEFEQLLPGGEDAVRTMRRLTSRPGPAGGPCRWPSWCAASSWPTRRGQDVMARTSCSAGPRPRRSSPRRSARALTKAWEAAGLAPLTPHEACHCAISYFIAAGLDWK